MSEATTYHLACHCQAHVIRLDLPKDKPFGDPGVCDCSHCLKRRIIWATAPSGSMTIVRGSGKDGVETKEYHMGENSFRHQVSGVLD